MRACYLAKVGILTGAVRDAIAYSRLQNIGLGVEKCHLHVRSDGEQVGREVENAANVATRDDSQEAFRIQRCPPIVSVLITRRLPSFAAFPACVNPRNVRRDW